MHEAPETYKHDDLLDVSKMPTQDYNLKGDLTDSDKSRLRMRHILPYGVEVHDGKEYLKNRNHEIMASRKAVSKNSGCFFDDGCSPWRHLNANSDSRLRCEAVLAAWILDKPLDPYLNPNPLR